ncbi:protein mono-ADP-ribosyltransferase PARP10 isoform X1 [Ambystoma mexicanum]|uniref:protein mono-ADP-ribosyltransferase PARP10 isoform X1 n=1 Tax=Ambystoma mexicanum TaxID=8296 RepID=UPI0037E70E58
MASELSHMELGEHRSMAEEADRDMDTVMVDGITDLIGTDLLLLYFESRRRSFGGPIRSHRRQGKTAVLTFENSEDAQRVLDKEQHRLLNVELSVRRVPPRDPGKVLLLGLTPDISSDVLELYVECVTNCDSGEYTLLRAPNGEEVLIQFHQPLTEAEFSYLEQKVSRRLLEGLVISVQRVQRTDQLLVSNLAPGLRADLLELYFESKRSDGGEVQDVTLLQKAGAAIVTFKNWEVADRVLRKAHRLQDCPLQVSPYYHFLHPQATADQEPPQTNPESVSVEDPMPSSFIDVLESWKLEMLRRSPELVDMRETFPGVVVELDKNGVRISGREKDQCQQVQGRILVVLRAAAQSHIPYETRILEFVQRNDVRARLEDLLRRTESSATYMVADCLLTVSASSVQAVRKASAELKEALCEFSVPVPESCFSVLHSVEFQELQASLSCCSLWSAHQDCIQAVCLREYEQENWQALQAFLQQRDQEDTVITMEPAMLRHLQLYNHELLVSMSEVTIEPLEGRDVTGFRILGGATVCQAAAEVIREVMYNTTKLQVKLEHPGIARFLLDERGQNILKELESRYRCVIDTERLWWDPSENEHELDSSFLQAPPSFERCAPDTAELHPATLGGSSNLEDIKAIVAAMEDDMDDGLNSGTLPGPFSQAGSQTNVQVQDQSGVLDDLYGEPQESEMDIYRDPETPIVIVESDEENCEDDTRGDANGSCSLEDDLEAVAGASDAYPDLVMAKRLSLALLDTGNTIDEKAEMHLAIQRSIDIMSQSAEDEERELNEALKFSLVSYQEEQKHKLDYMYKDCPSDMAVDNFEAALEISMGDSIRAANSAEVTIYGDYDKDLQLIADQLRQAIKAKLTTETEMNSCLCKLPNQYRLYLAHLERKHAVEISIQGSVATIHGFVDYTVYATRDITKLINRMLQEEQLILEQAEVCKDVRWVWYNQQEREIPYSSSANAFIECAWRKKQKLLDIVFDNKPYSIDFDKMEEYSIESLLSTRIARMDVNGSCAAADVSEMSENKVELAIVDEASDEFRKVVRTFYDTLEAYHSKIKIIKVEKVSNPLLYSQYQLKKKSLERSGCPEPVERMLYHGTSEASAKEICQYGFNRSFCGKNATRYGQGVYFAVQSVLSVLDFYSPRNTEGNKYIFVVKTLTGEFTVGTEGMKVPPLKEGSEVPLRYDSLVDDVKKPTIFVIFNDTQAYPQYLITCTKN